MALRFAALALLLMCLTGCGAKEEDDMKASSIAVPQEGNGPPPLSAPMKEGNQTSGQ
ncbi:hypothetical protein MCEMSE15_02852 [Fimbriimonadaceae bacterium]